MHKDPTVPQKIALLWATESLGLYSNKTFDTLYKGIGHNNGNLAFVYAIASQLEGQIRYLPWHTNAEALNKYDVIVIPCANQFGKHTELSGLARIFEKVDKPVVAIGLGAQADSFDADVEVSEGTLAWARAINARRGGSSSNIYTRGPYTSRQLARYDIADSVVGGCPSHFIAQSANLGRTIQKNWRAISIPRSISVAGGHQSWAKVRQVEQQLVALMMDPACMGQYVVQSMGDMIRISRGDFDAIEGGTLDKIRNHIIPHYTRDEFLAWCNNYARSFYDVASWMDSVRRYDLTIGPRYHGTQLAIQAGRMGAVITIDSRTEELCRQTGVPFIPHADIRDVPLTRTELKKRLPFDGAAYDEFRRERAQNYVTFLEANGLQARPFVHMIAGEEQKHSVAVPAAVVA